MMRLIAILIASSLLSGCASTPDLGVVHVRGEIKGHRVDVPFQQGLTLARAIVSAGGFTDFSTGIRVERDDETILFVKGTHEIHKPKNLELPLKPEDIVSVRRMH